MAFCNCNAGLSNTKTPDCQTIQSVTKKLIYVPIYGSNGERNAIDVTDTIDDLYINNKLQAEKGADRWYPTPFIENVEDTKGDNITESLNSGSNIFIQEGARTFTGVHIKESTTFLGKLKSGRCVDFGVYMVDINGYLTGSISADGTKLYPVAVDKETYNPMLMKATDTTTQKIQVTFEFSRIERDENLRSIAPSETSIDFLTINGLIDATMTEVTSDVNGVDFTVAMDYGTFFTKTPVTGLVDTDFDVFNDTTQSNVVIASVTETADGAYTLTYSVAQNGGDNIRIILRNLSGFEADDLAVTA